MNSNIIENRLQNYSPKTQQEELNAIKEIYQEIALAGLARSDFFKVGAFQGGTCLRILYALERFSEDLDFVLIKDKTSFDWEHYLKAIELEFHSFGLDLEILNRSQADAAVQRAFIKQNSFGKVLRLRNKWSDRDKKSIKIKLEIDSNPPMGSKYQIQYLNFPYPVSILSQDFSSLFASKCHALLCRPFVKGRDWFDFLWYIQRKSKINLELLENALFQFGPYKNKKLNVTTDWVLEALRKQILSIDWQEALRDVTPFLKLENQKFVQSWSTDLFLAMVDQLKNNLI